MILTPLAFKTLVSVGLIAAVCVAMVQWRAGSREAEARDTNPPSGQFVEVEGTEIHLKVSGQGTDIILIHGASGSLRDFTFDLAERLSSTHRVIAIDRPGLGWSERPPGYGGVWSKAYEPPRLQARLLQGAADAVGVTNPIVVGHSFGGAIALAWAIERPKDTAGLVLLAGVANPWPGKLGWLYRMNSTRFGSLVAIPLITALTPRTVFQDMLGEIFAPQRPPEGYLAHFGPEMSLRRSALRANAQQVNNLKPHIREMVTHYGSLTMPVEILHGEADKTVPMDIHAEPLSAQLPDAVLTRMPGIGHMPHHADVEATVDAITRVERRAGLR